MALVTVLLSCSVLFLVCEHLNAGPEGGIVTGIVTFKGTALKAKVLDLTKEAACVKMHEGDPLVDEGVVTGGGNGLANVVVYISVGEANPTAVPAKNANFKEQDCRYKTHVLAIQAGQEINIVNSDLIAHNIHPLAKVNREGSRIQPPGTPPFSYSYEKEEIISVKCNIHPWMQGYFVVLKTSHFAVTSEDGVFRPGNTQSLRGMSRWEAKRRKSRSPAEERRPSTLFSPQRARA